MESNSPPMMMKKSGLMESNSPPMMMKKSGVEGGKVEEVVLDGSNLIELVENEEVFSKFAEHKFEELDRDKDGNLSVKELQPAVSDIGAALGLPAQGSSPDTDQIYSQVLNEFTHEKQGRVSPTKFKEVLSDIFLGMAAGLKRDPIVILRMDGDDLLEFISSPRYETEMISIYSQIDFVNGTIRDYVVKALNLLSIEHGMPPCSDSWIMSNIVEPALQSHGKNDGEGPISQEVFLEEFKLVAETMIRLLQEQPVIVAHSEQTFYGSSIRRLLSNNFEFNKIMDAAMKDLPRDRNGNMSKDNLRVTLNLLGPSAGLPPYGAIDQMDNVVNEVTKTMDADDGKVIEEEEFKKLMTEILGSIMLQLEGNPISVTSNSVVHEPLSSSTLLNPKTTS